jgi:hypothetical protein
MGFVFDTRGNYDWGLGWLVISATAGALALSQIRHPAYTRIGGAAEPAGQLAATNRQL